MILKTARLTLRPQEQADASALFAILSDEAAMRFWNRPAMTRLAVCEELLREHPELVFEFGDALEFCRMAVEVASQKRKESKPVVNRGWKKHVLLWRCKIQSLARKVSAQFH